jgi:parallel beta-helix repeat protein
MNDAPRRKLREIIERHGREIIENPRRVEGLLRDYCGAYRREISVLTMALEEHAIIDLLAAPASLPRQVLISRLTQRLCDNLALSETAARWSIESWAWVLGIISDAELTTGEGTAPKQNAAGNVLPQAQTMRNAPTNKTAQRQTTAAQAATVTTLNTVFTVAKDGGGNFSSIAQALGNVAANSKILVREGIYNESIRLDKNVEIVGDGKVENIVLRSGDQSCVSMQSERATIRGLTIQGRGKSSGKAFFAVDIPRGELVLDDCDITSDSLSCVGIRGANSNPFLKNCRIHDGADSGIYLFDNARARIENCDVYQNRNANLAVTQGAHPAVKNCRFYAGENGGIVVWGNGAAATIEDCEILNHRLANVGISQSANPIFRRCAIFGGRDSGVFVHQKGCGVFEECEIHDNAKAEVAVTDGGNTNFSRCTIYNGRESGVFVSNRARANLESCNIYDNADAGVSVIGESVVRVNRCNIHRNNTVAVRVKERSSASVENSDLRGNRIATWETEHGVVVERKNNRE